MLSRSGETARPRTSRSSPTLPITVTFRAGTASTSAAREARPADATREQRRPSCAPFQQGERRLRPRRRAEREPCEIGERVDVVGQVGDHGGDRVERRPPQRGRGSGRRSGRRRGARTPMVAAARVRSSSRPRPRRAPIAPSSAAPASVRRSCGTTQGTSALTTSTGSSGRPASAASTASPWPPPGSAHDLGAELARERGRVRVGGHHDRARGRHTRGEDVAEHGERELRPQLVRRAPAVACRCRHGTE